MTTAADKVAAKAPATNEIDALATDLKAAAISEADRADLTAADKAVLSATAGKQVRERL